MLNRRILRVKAFKQLYACAENPDLTLKEALEGLESSCEATRDLYLYMLALIPALTEEAQRRIEAARGKFNPTEEDLHPRMKFARNAVAVLFREDPDFQRLLEKKKFSWAQNDAFLHTLYERLKTRQWFQDYLDAPGSSLEEDIALWKRVFEEELEDDADLEAILEDLSIHWPDDLPYALGTCIGSLEQLSRGGWSFPPLYQSEVLTSRGKKDVDSDRAFVRQLLSTAYARYSDYSALIAASVSKWDLERIYTTDIVLIALGLAEAETFPEIPVKVSINEYVEIAKYYSTPKSRVFVNGLLDKLIREKMASGAIVKQGRGLN